MALSRHFEFQLNGTVLTDEPKNWDGAKIVVERDPVLKGVFINYIEQLEFCGDGYDILMNLIDSGGYCQDIDFESYEVDHNGARISDGFSYRGFIDLSAIEINRSKRIIKSTIENQSLSYIIRKYKSVKIPVNVTGKTINGETIANIGQDFIIGNPVHKTVKAEYVGNILSYMISYLTDNRADFVSDWFTTQEFLLGETTVGYNSNDFIVATENLSYTNFFGETINQTLNITLLNSALYTVITGVGHEVTRVPYIVGSGDVRYEGIDEYRHRTLMQFGDPGIVTTGGGNTFYSLWDICDVNFQSDRATSIVVEQLFSDGGANCAIVTGGELTGQSISGEVSGVGTNINVSFEEFFKSLDAIFNLMTVFYIENGRVKIRIEPEDYFYQNTALLSLTSIEGVTEKLASDLLFRSINIDLNIVDTNNPGYNSYGIGPLGHYWSKTPIKDEISLVAGGCGEKDKDIAPKFLTSNITQYQTFSAKDLFFFETDGTAENFLVRYNTQFNWYNDGVNDRISVNHAQLTSLSALPILVAKRHLGAAAASALYSGEPLDLLNTMLLKRDVKFVAPLSPDQLNTILEFPYYYFDIEIPNANGAGETHFKQAYIKKLTYPIKDGNATFELYTS